MNPTPNLTTHRADSCRIKQHIALKVLAADAYGYIDNTGEWQSKAHTFEREILQSIDSIRSDHPGRKHLPSFLTTLSILGLMGPMLVLSSESWVGASTSSARNGNLPGFPPQSCDRSRPSYSPPWTSYTASAGSSTQVTYSAQPVPLPVLTTQRHQIDEYFA